MDCREIRDSLDAFIDGEMEPAEIAAVEAHLESCDACQSELQAMNGLGALLQTGLAEEARRVADEVAEAGRFDAMWSRIEDEIRRPERTTTREPGLWERLQAWWTAQSGPSVWVPAAAAAATLAIIVGLVVARQDPGLSGTSDAGRIAAAPVAELPPFAAPQPATPMVANNDEAPALEAPPRRRAPEGMVAHNEALIVDYEVDRGIVLIEQDPDEPDQPMVVWHLVDEDEPGSAGSEG